MNAEKMKSKKKVPKKLELQRIKKPLIGGGIIVAVAIAGIVGGIIIFKQLEEQKPDIFIYGTGSIEYWVDDPLLFGNREVYAILTNIAEALFEYEITSEGSRIVPNLALEGVWSNAGLNFTCPLRQDVKFHDGTPFNANVVKWNFDRHYRLQEEIYYDSWLHPDGTPIINDTVIIDEYTIRFVLNKPFIPLKALLGRAPLIVSPSSTPADNFTYFNIGELVGTGPFRYNSSERIWDPIFEKYFPLNITLLPNLNYWGHKPKFDIIIIKFFDNATLMDEAMLSGDIHYTDHWSLGPEAYKDISGISYIEHMGENDYITMDNSVINVTMRKAISYALDYTLLVPLGKGYSSTAADVIRCRSPLTNGMLYSNWEDFSVPEYNITKARQTIIEDLSPFNALVAGLTANNNVSAGNPWEMLAKDNPISKFNFSYVVGIDWLKEIAFLFQDNLTQIGVNVDTTGVAGRQYSASPSQFFVLGWMPDYLDPHNTIYGCFSNASRWLWGNINDAQVQKLMEDAVKETNETVREQQYNDIQKCLIEEVYPIIWWYSPIYKHPISAKIRGYSPNNPWKHVWKDWYFK